MQLVTDMHPSGRWTLGFLMALTNMAMSSIGFVLQRKSELMQQAEALRNREMLHVDAEEAAGDPQKARCCGKVCWIWVVGVTLYVLAAVPDLISYTLVPQVVCTTVACFRLVVVTVLGHWCLHERVQGREIVGMFLCTVGTCLCLTLSPLPEDLKESEGSAGGIFHHPQVLAYLGVGLGCLVAMLLVAFAPELGCDAGSRLVQFSLPAATGLAFALEKVFNTEIGFLELSKHPLPWLGMAGGIAVLGLLDFALNLRGAAKMPLQVFLPVSFTLSTTLQYFQSVVIFDEFKDMDPLASTMSVGSALVALLGAVVIMTRRSPELGHQPLSEDGSEADSGAEECFPISPHKDSLLSQWAGC